MLSMLSKSILLLLGLVVCFAQYEPLISKEFEEKLRSEVTWEVENYENNVFKGWTVSDFLDLVNTNEQAPISIADDSGPSPDFAPPESFDGRHKWPKCIHPIRIQGHCGSCWAFGCSGAVSDRFCIAGHDVLLAPQDMVSCDRSGHGCNGGDIEHNYFYFEHTGLLSEHCFPYVSGQAGHVPPCPVNKCPNSAGQYIKYKCVAGSTKRITNLDTMKEEISTHGPITTRHDIYEDFNYYKGGIYYHKAGRLMGGHVMRVVGWGVEGGVHYWIIANTFGEGWGEKGYVKFKMHDCSVDGYMMLCMPKV